MRNPPVVLDDDQQYLAVDRRCSILVPTFHYTCGVKWFHHPVGLQVERQKEETYVPSSEKYKISPRFQTFQRKSEDHDDAFFSILYFPCYSLTNECGNYSEHFLE